MTPALIERVAPMATLCDTGGVHIVVPKSWIKKRVMASLKEDYDRMRRQQERKQTAAIGTFAQGLIEGGKRNGR